VELQERSTNFKFWPIFVIETFNTVPTEAICPAVRGWNIWLDDIAAQSAMGCNMFGNFMPPDNSKRGKTKPIRRQGKEDELWNAKLPSLPSTL
jgi:hypothetical protein